MFTGIVESLGQVKKISRRGNITLLEVVSEAGFKDVNIGDSIAVNGACLTVVKNENGVLSFEAMPETLKATNLGELLIADKVNLEKSLRFGDRISGHFVSGHIDCAGVIRSKRVTAGNLSLEFAVPATYLRFCLPKGSVAVDGVSLTVQSVRSNLISVYIIPHTLKNTTLSFKGPSDKVNIEFDILAKKAAK